MKTNDVVWINHPNTPLHGAKVKIQRHNRAGSSFTVMMEEKRGAYKKGDMVTIPSWEVSKYKPESHPPHPPGNPIAERGGCKVAWKTYATESEAKAAADWAKVEAARKAAQGYDFGYCSPGTYRKVDGGFEVTFP